MIVREHVWDEAGQCIHCRDHRRDNTGESEARSCIAREVARPVPPSVFEKPWEIGERSKEIMKEENRSV